MSKKKRDFAVRFPRYARGIRAQGTRNDTWWEKRWHATLDRMDLTGREGRGRNYAQSGQVTELVRNGAHVEALVTGVRREPYRVTVDFRVPEGLTRTRIVKALKGEPMLVARLLADDLPIEVEEIFRRENLDFFPGGKIATEAGKNVYDMTTSCTCPDYANPCKHVFAVLFLLGEEVARHPMTLVELRGIRAEELY